MQFKSSKSHDSVHMTSPSLLLTGQSSYNFPVVSSINLSLFWRSAYNFIIILAAHAYDEHSWTLAACLSLNGDLLKRAPIQHCFAHVFSSPSSSDSHEHVCLCTNMTVRTSVCIFIYTCFHDVFFSFLGAKSPPHIHISKIPFVQDNYKI